MYRQEFLSAATVALFAVTAGCSALDSDGNDDHETDDDGDEDPQTALFEVSTLNPSAWTIEAGVPIDVRATITNTGAEIGDQAAELRVSDDVLASEPISLEPNEDEVVSFANVETDALDLGSHTIGIFSEDDSETGTLEIPRRLEPGSDGSERGVLRSIRDVAGRFDPSSYDTSGARDETLPGFDLDDGLTVVTFEHGIGREFTVDLLDASGTYVTEVGTYTGDIEGAVAVPMVAGEYTFQISTVGSSYWNIGVAQPSPPQKAVHVPPVTASGTGPDVVGPVELDGEVTVRASYDGDEPFELTCYDNDATSLSEALGVFEESGGFEGETTVEFEGTTWLGIDATGAWEFEID